MSGSPATAPLAESPVNRHSRKALNFTISGAIVLFVAFAVLHGPEYVTGSPYGAFLWPLVILLLPVIAVLATMAIVHSQRSVESAGDVRPRDWRSRVGLIGGIALIVLEVPVLWFGNAPLVILGG